MLYSVSVPKSVLKQISNLPSTICDRIIERVERLAEQPHPPGSKKLKAIIAWSVRVGEYRIIYDVDEKRKVIVLRSVGHRKEIYR
jgi:mRNA interferase RelE/StbE